MATNTSTISYDRLSLSARMRRWRRALITKEDKFHLHKLLGILVLLSIACRLLQTRSSDLGFQNHPEYTLPTIILHVLLNLTSLQFAIPARRIKDGGRIWPEYRLHAFVFATRSLLLILYYHYERKLHWKPNPHINYLAMLYGLSLADLASASVSHRSRSVRDIDAHPLARFFFSFMQFQANAGMLVAPTRTSTLPYLIVMVVTLTPFLGTLRRKNMLPSNLVGAGLYGALLVYGGVVVQLEYQRHGESTAYYVRTIGNLACVLRMRSLSKYWVWTGLYGVIWYSRSTEWEPEPMVARSLWAVTFVGVLWTAYEKTTMSATREVSKQRMDGPKIR